jgi:hypothetical protein
MAKVSILCLLPMYVIGNDQHSLPITNVNFKNNKKRICKCYFSLYLHTHVYNQISTLHTDTSVHSSMNIKHNTCAHMDSYILRKSILVHFNQTKWDPMLGIKENINQRKNTVLFKYSAHELLYVLFKHCAHVNLQMCWEQMISTLNLLNQKITRGTHMLRATIQYYASAS